MRSIHGQSLCGGETVYVRQSGSDEKTLIKSPEDDTNQLNLFND